MNPSKKSWCFTLNNYNDDEYNNILDWDKNYLVLGKEVGEEGTPHLQGCITFKKAKRLTALKKLNARIHWEPAKELEAARNYCMKDGDYVIQDNRTQGARNDISQAVATLQTDGLNGVRNNHPTVYLKYHMGFKALQNDYECEMRTRKPNVVWSYGPTGTGKTKSFYDFVEHRGGINNNNIYIKDSTKWWDGYKGQPYILIDDFRGAIPFNMLLRILDRYPMNVEVKGGYRQLANADIFITSAHSPLATYQSDRVKEDIQQLIRRIDIVWAYWEDERRIDVKQELSENVEPAMEYIRGKWQSDEIAEGLLDPDLDAEDDVLDF